MSLTNGAYFSLNLRESSNSKLRRAVSPVSSSIKQRVRCREALTMRSVLQILRSPDLVPNRSRHILLTMARKHDTHVQEQRDAQRFRRNTTDCLPWLTSLRVQGREKNFRCKHRARTRKIQPDYIPPSPPPSSGRRLIFKGSPIWKTSAAPGRCRM